MSELLIVFLLEFFLHVLRFVVLLFLPVRELLRWRGWRAAVLFSAAVLLSTAATAFVWLLLSSPYSRLIASCLGVFLAYLICRLMLKGASRPILFAVFMQASYGDCVNLIIRVAGLLLGGGRGGTLSPRIAALVLSVLTLPLMYAFMRRYVRPMLLDRARNALWRPLWLIPACFYFVFRLGVYPGYFPTDNRVSSPWMLLLLAWPVVTALIYMVLLKLIHNLIERLELQARLEEGEALLALQEELYEHQRADVEQARIVRHDLRHHLLVVEGLLDCGRVEEADRYLSGAIAGLGGPCRAAPISPSSGRAAVQPAGRGPQ